MFIHREGKATIIVAIIVSILIGWLFCQFLPNWMWFGYAMIAFLMVTVLQFFRNPTRPIPSGHPDIVTSPADGKVVVIEKVFEEEFLKTDCLQVSIFMSPTNVHVNRNPISGKVIFNKYHPGKYLAAWNPKSSTENERTTIVYQHNEHKVLMRQVAGAMARRIVNYLKDGQEVSRGGEMGFIKFGSRVDLYFPLGTEVLVSVGDKVSGNVSEIARLQE